MTSQGRAASWFAMAVKTGNPTSAEPVPAEGEQPHRCGEARQRGDEIRGTRARHLIDRPGQQRSEHLAHGPRAVQEPDDECDEGGRAFALAVAVRRKVGPPPRTT